MIIKLMITDDHIMIREGIKNLLEFDKELKVIAEASNGDECIEVLRETKPEILLLDINMPIKNGIETLQEIRKLNKEIKILMLTVHNEVEYLVKAMDIGINGYVLKDTDSAELIKAIKMIYKGETYIQPDLIPALNSKLINRDSDVNKIHMLTNRELEVLIQVANGQFNKEIANTLCISERTVKNHMSNIFKKIEVADRTQAAVFAIRNNLISI